MRSFTHLMTTKEPRVSRSRAGKDKTQKMSEEPKSSGKGGEIAEALGQALVKINEMKE